MSDDRQFIRRVLEGEAEAEKEFVDRYSGLILGLAKGRFGLSNASAEEVLQATLTRLWERDRRALRAWRGNGSFASYVSVIAIRFCMIQRQAEQSRPEDGVDLDRLPHTDPRPGADAEVISGERLRLVSDTMRQLSPRDSLLLALRFGDERSVKDISTVLGLTRGGARKALHDALRRLRQRLMARQPDLFQEPLGASAEPQPTRVGKEGT